MMLNILIYIGKSSIATGIFYLVFLLLFKKQKHFDFNRLYLLVSLMISFIIPLITIPTVKFVDMAITDGSGSTIVYLPTASAARVLPESSFSFFHYLFGGFVLGILAFSLHLIISHLKAIRIINNCRVVQLFDHPVHITTKDVHPFSFFNKIIISEKILSSPDLEMIVSHERIHVQEKHTIDILIAEMMFLFQWFNPFAWLIKEAVRNNLEYKTDNEIIQNYNPQNYQLAMVALAGKDGVSPFLTALNGSQLKNRIIMMKKKTKSKFAIVKQLVVLPLLVILVVGLSNKKVISKPIQIKKAENNSVIEKQNTRNSNNGSYGWEVSGGFNGEISMGNPDAIKLSPSTEKGLRVQVNQTKSNFDKTKPMVIYVDGKLLNPQSDKDFDFDNANIEDFGKLINVLPENIESIEVLKDGSSIALLGEEAKDKTVLLIKTKSTISTALDLRKAIAAKIKFPIDAADLNSELSLSLYATISESGKITKITEQIAENEQYITVGEVVLEAQRVKSDVQKSENEYKELLGKEAKRVLEDLPRMEIPEWKGKVVKFQFIFRTE